MDEVRQRGSALPVAVKSIREKLSNIFTGHGGKDDGLHSRSRLADGRERVHQRMGGADFVVPVGPDE